MKKELSGTELLSALSEISAPSGNERPVLEFIKAQTEKHCDKTYYDKAGNLICEIRAEKPTDKKLMLCSSVDEAGFMINDIDDEGHLKISPLGGINTAVMSGRRVRICHGNKTVTGIVSSKPIHSLSRDERAKPTPADKLYIELGTGSRAETEKLVDIGDIGCFDSAPEYFGDGYFTCKALDFRAGCAAMCEVMRSVDKSKLDKNLYFAFTVLGSAGLKESGATVAANVICPDEAVIFATLGASDVYGAKERDIICALGAGVVVSGCDGRTIYSPEMTEKLRRKLTDAGISTQPNRNNAGGGIAAEIQRSGAGAAVASVYLPVRYPRTPSCVINTEDYKSFLAAAGMCI